MRKGLGKLELQVMNLVWDKGNATVRDVWETLYPQKRLAYTTIATVMKNLESKGFLKHEEKDRAYIYRPATDREEVSQGIVKEMIDGFFDGSAAKLVNALIQGEHLTDKDLKCIQKMIVEYRREAEND